MNLQTSDLNTAAADLAQKAIDGHISENDARLAIAGVIESADVPAAVAREQRGISDRTRRDLASLLSDMMVGRVTGTGGFRKSLELERIAAGDDVMGWARQLLRQGVVSKLRDLRSNDDHHILVSPTAPDSEEEFNTIANKYHNASSPSAEDLIDENRFSASLTSLGNIKNLRENGQIKQNARHLRFAYQISAPVVVPESPADRDWVTTQLREDPMLAYAALSAWLHIDRPTAIDDRLLFIWDDFTTDEGEDLAERGPAFVRTIALGAVLLLPKPSRDVMRSAVKVAELSAPGSAWAENAAGLIGAWVARECAPFSEFRAKRSKAEIALEKAAIAVAKEHAAEAGMDEVATEGLIAIAINSVNAPALAEREARAARWPSLVAATAAWHKAPFGTTEDAISAFIGRIFAGIDAVNFPV